MSGEHRVSTMSPTLGQRQRAAAFALLMACGCALAVPLADTRIPLFSGLGIINDTAFALLGLIVAALLYLQFRATRAPAVLVLASGFLLLSLTTLPQLLRESQGAFIDLRLLFVADFSLPAAAIAYALLRRGVAGATGQERAASQIVAALAATIALAALATWITAVSVEPGSGVPTAEASLWWRTLAATALCASLLAAIALLWQRRSSVLDLWLLVALTAWFIDALLRATAADDSSITWHFARLYGLLGIGCILYALLAENLALFLRLERQQARGPVAPHTQAVLGEVTEQLSQPLCAITANADAIGRMLDHERPDLAEVRAALADIIQDAGRANDTLRDAERSAAGEPRSANS